MEAVGGFVPQAGDSFRILNAASRTGEFLSVVGTSPGGSLAYTVEYDATGAILVVTDLSVSVADVTVTEGDCGIVSAVFDVTLATPRPGQVTVAYATANGTAAAPGDFAPAAGSVVFEPGQTAKTVAVQVNGDLLSEADETFFVNLSNAQGTAIAKGEGVGTILDDDELPVLSITDRTAVEGNSGTSDAVFTVSLAPASGREVSVRFTTANGTATSGSDFSGASGTLTFAPGETSKTVTVRVTGDLLAEGDETFFVDLTDPVAATISDPRGAGTIVDDDLVSLTIGDTAVTEGNAGTTTATFPVTLSGAGTDQVTVAYATGNDSATAPDDFLPAGGTLTFAPGETSKSIEVAVNGDTLPEPNEQFGVTLSNPDNAAVADGLGIGTIADDGDESGTPDFQLLVSPTSQVLPPGGSVQYTVSAIGLFGFAAPLVLEALELPAGVTTTFSTNPLVIPGTSTLTLSSTGAATIGSHGFVIRATGGGLVRELRASSTLDFGLIRICTGAFEGWVTDTETGAPISGVSIVGAISPAVTTDANGYYRANGAGLGDLNAPLEHLLQTGKDGYWGESAEGLAVCGQVTRVDFSLLKEAPGTIPGTVVVGVPDAQNPAIVHPTATPIEGATVELPFFAIDESGADGSFNLEFDHLKPNNEPLVDAQLQAFRDGFWTRPADERGGGSLTSPILIGTVAPGPHEPVVVPLVPLCGGTVTGVVTDEVTGCRSRARTSMSSGRSRSSRSLRTHSAASSIRASCSATTTRRSTGRSSSRRRGTSAAPSRPTWRRAAPPRTSGSRCACCRRPSSAGSRATSATPRPARRWRAPRCTAPSARHRRRRRARRPTPTGSTRCRPSRF